MSEIAPGATIGILGGGQLGRMLCIAAARLGYRTHVLCPEPDPPAGQIASRTTTVAFDDAAAMSAFAQAVDVATFEFENVPAETLRLVARTAPVRPGARVLEVTQDRLREKSLCAERGLPTTPFAPVSSPDDFGTAVAATGLPAILKTRRMGYDGKGQRTIRSREDLDGAWMDLGAGDCLLEAFVAFDAEISVIVARSVAGKLATFDIPRNRHADGILRESHVPAGIGEAAAATARDIAHRLAASLDYVGVLAVEMFTKADGAVLVNEIAPRVHNSGHWTIEACATDQFEQHIRAVCGLPLGSTERFADVQMTNLIGDEAETWRDALNDPAAKLHLYGKSETRPGRKMGHVTRLILRGTDAAAAGACSGQAANAAKR